jgi:hypothetical protein
MNFQFYIEKLFNSKEFVQFKKDNPTAFLCSGFFSIDKKKSDNQQHLDYFIPELNKMFSFKLNQNPIEMTPIELFIKDVEQHTPEKISDNFNFNFEDILKMVEIKMNEENIKNNIEKTLWSIQNKNGKTFLIGTVFLSNLGIIKVNFDLNDKKITDFEKKSFFDFIKVMKKT